MALRPQTGLETHQRLGLSPSVMTGLLLLKFPAAELAEHLAAAAQRNPFLRFDPPRDARFFHAAFVQTSFTDSVSAKGEPGTESVAPWQERVAQQIARKPLSEEIKRLALIILAELDNRGRLETPLSALAEQEQVSLATMELALCAVQSCEPAGIGARDLAECLALQLVAEGLDPTSARATVAEMPRFARGDIKGAARALGLSEAEAQARARLFRGLSPDPIAASAPSAPPIPVLPDLVLERSLTGHDRVRPLTEMLPRVRLDPALVRRAESEGFARELLAEARALLQALAARESTLVRIGNWLVARQAAALAAGPSALVPATRADCAEALGMHASTVGRAVAGKTLLADGRLWKLEHLFSRGINRKRSETLSARAAAAKLAQLLIEEAAAEAVSDAELAKRLAAKGITIARRTVTKYRARLGVPSARLRRQSTR